MFFNLEVGLFLGAERGGMIIFSRCISGHGFLSVSSYHGGICNCIRKVETLSAQFAAGQLRGDALLQGVIGETKRTGAGKLYVYIVRIKILGQVTEGSLDHDESARGKGRLQLGFLGPSAVEQPPSRSISSSRCRMRLKGRL